MHKLYVESEELRTKLAKEFGESILLDNGRDIDRKKLSDLVFKDKVVIYYHTVYLIDFPSLLLRLN